MKVDKRTSYTFYRVTLVYDGKPDLVSAEFLLKLDAVDHKRIRSKSLPPHSKMRYKLTRVKVKRPILYWGDIEIKIGETVFRKEDIKSLSYFPTCKVRAPVGRTLDGTVLFGTVPSKVLSYTSDKGWLCNGGDFSGTVDKQVSDWLDNIGDGDIRITLEGNTIDTPPENPFTD